MSNAKQTKKKVITIEHESINAFTMLLEKAINDKGFTLLEGISIKRGHFIAFGYITEKVDKE